VAHGGFDADLVGINDIIRQRVLDGAPEPGRGAFLAGRWVGQWGEEGLAEGSGGISAIQGASI
jgi:hypothetical protein